jgi:hypothetical protein
LSEYLFYKRTEVLFEKNSERLGILKGLHVEHLEANNFIKLILSQYTAPTTIQICVVLDK